MLQEYSRAPGGASLTAAFSLLMNHPSFKASVAQRMTHREKLRLFALHEQAIHGDAPFEDGGQHTARAEVPSPSPSAEKADNADASNAHLGAASVSIAKTAASSLAKRSPSPSRPRGVTHWFDFAGKARRQQWAALRGRMTPQVAREAFCAEFLAMLDKYPSAEIVPLVEAALCRAKSANDSDVDAASLSNPAAAASASRRRTAEEKKQQRQPPSPPLMFCIRAFQHDPAAAAMLWVCRAHGIPCEITAEPLSRAVTFPHASATASLHLNGGRRQHGTNAQQQRRPPRRGSEKERDLFYTAVSFMEGRVFVPIYAGVRRGQRFIAEVEGAAAGFQLLCDVFLSHMPHWAGLSGQTKEPGSHLPASDVAWRTRQAAERAEWLEDLALATAHLRTPVMGLLIEEATGVLAEATRLVEREAERQERAIVEEARDRGPTEGKTVATATHNAACKDSFSSFLAARPHPQVRAVAAHLNHFQRSFVKGKVQRSGFERVAREDACGGAPATWRPLLPNALLDAGAAVQVVDDFFSPRARAAPVAGCRLVSCVDVYIACCGYVLCTSPFSQRLFPQWNGMSCDEAAWLVTRASAFGTEVSDARRANGAIPSSPQPPPHELPAVRLAGMPPGYNDIINAVLRRETRSSLRLLREPLSTTSTFTAADPACHAGDCGESVPNAYAAVEAVEKLMQARVLSLNNDDIASKAAGAASPTTWSSELVNGALTPYAVLARVFTGAWSLSQRQCVGFPFCLLAETPARQVNFLWDDPQQRTDRQQRAAVAAVPENWLGRGEGFGVDTWESRLREVGWAVVGRILSSVAAKDGPGQKAAAAAAAHQQTRVYRTDGFAQAKL